MYFFLHLTTKTDNIVNSKMKTRKTVKDLKKRINKVFKHQ